MKRRRNAIVLLALSCLAAAPGRCQTTDAPASVRAGRPSDLIRALGETQDRLAMGDAGAKARLPALIARLADEFRAFDPQLYAQPRNLQAAVAYTLGGGQPRVMRRILQSGVAPQDQTDLAVGALAYAEGREDEARDLLGKVDPLAAPPSVAGLLALAKAALTAKTDPAGAARLLDQARVLAPGGLVEETALRRSVVLAYAASDFSRFVSASSQYFRRYARSLYAEDFRRSFAAAVARFGLADEPERRSRLAELLGEMDESYRVDLYLNMARVGLLMGRAASARAAAEKALDVARDGAAGARARLYAGAAKIVGGDFEEGAADLAAADDAKLGRDDRALRAFVIRLASQMSSQPRASERDEAQGAASDDSPASKLIGAAELSLSQTAGLLKGARP
ncbi:chemotaxis protein MotC [Methylocella sp.]|uniref:chemotaxis protein MotC n=1 Tax=Methylocella sp. TaxID=1978226 RepID=UPI0035B2AF4E